ncbi:MAG: hypothetical protein J4G15_16595 [Alphaproteobacteria bacterium]|nr:hypothetical protein [Alphaproteobacteria bacterium]
MVATFEPFGQPDRSTMVKARAQGVKHWRLSMSLVLSVCFGTLITVSMAAVLGITVMGATRNTIDLIHKEAELGVSLVAREIDLHLAAARTQTAFVAGMLETGKVDVDDGVRLESLLTGAMAADPAIGGQAFIFPGGEAVIVDRLDPPARSYHVFSGDDPLAAEALARAVAGDAPFWMPPNWRPDYEATVLTLIWPVRRNAELLGVLVTAISIQQLSARMSPAVESLRSQVFALFGRDRVLAHELMAGGYPGLSVADPLPPLETFADPGLAGLWYPRTLERIDLPETANIESHTVEVDGTVLVFVYRSIDAYVTVPLLVGAYYRSEVFDEEFGRLINSVAIGVAAILLSLVVAMLIGRRLSRPLERLSAASRLVGRMDLDHIETLPPSRVIELDHQADAFNSMSGALTWFQAYVPRALVRQIMHAGDMAELESDHRNITVMFTDIAGYSTVSEGMSAAGVTTLLNHHFSILTEEIEAEGGTVDKFIGDGVMAFWGAPEKQKNRARRACRAALAIRRRIEEDNRAREASGDKALRMRIGIHSGQATVANIGSPTRLNYTVIGDTVNVAQRLEQLGRDVAPLTEVAITISAETARDAGHDFAATAAGSIPVKGRAAPVEVLLLEGVALS